MQKARCHFITKLQPLVSTWFQVLFTPLFTVLFTFPSQYLFAIGLSVVFSLTGWCRWIQREFLRFPLTQDTKQLNICTYTGLSPFIAILPRIF
jgi:hypothetical protein